MSSTYQLVYISRTTLPLDDAAAMRLRVECQAFNSRNDVTGLLLYDGLRFIQALEGREQMVLDTMDRIVRDPRHQAIAHVRQGVVPRRQFGEWAMKLYCINDRDSAGTFVDDVKRAVAHVDDINLSAAFIGFAVLGRAELLRARTA